MSVQTPDRYIEITPGLAGGEPHIRGHRIKVRDIVVWHEQMGRSADEIASEYGLSLAQVYAALAFYFDNRDAIDGAIARHRDFVDDLRRNLSSPLERKLSAKSG